MSSGGWQPPGGDQPYGGPPETGQPPMQPYAPDNPVVPQYPPAGYPPAAYPPGGYPGYPAVGYPGYGAYPTGYPAAYPGYAIDPRDVRPGATMGAAVLAYVTAGLLVLAGGLLLLGASIVADIESASNSHTTYGVEFALDGTADLVASGLLIAGGVLLTGRKANGRVIMTVGNGIVAALSLYWLIRFGGVALAGFLFYTILFAALAVVSLVLSWLTPVTAWLTPRR